MSYANVVSMNNTVRSIFKEINILQKKPQTPETVANIKGKEKRVREIRAAISCYKRAYGLR